MKASSHVTSAVMSVLSGLMLLAPGAVLAQSGPLQNGQHALAFGVPNAGGITASIWKITSQRSMRGLQVGAELNHHQETGADRTGAQLSLGPEWKWFSRSSRPVVPFIQAGGALDYSYSSAETPDGGSTSNWSLGPEVAVGGGADWFASDGISIAGFVGGRFDAMYNHAQGGHSWDISVGTVVSSLTLFLYF